MIIDFEIGPGPQSEIQPAEALDELARQLEDPTSALRCGTLWKQTASATLSCMMPGWACNPQWGHRGPVRPWPPPCAPMSTKPEVSFIPFAFPSHEGARRLLRGLLTLVLGGSLSVREVVRVLDSAAQKVSDHCPRLWQPLVQAPTWLAQVLESDSFGVAVATAAWQALHLRTSSTAAVVALRSLATPEGDRGGLRVTEATVRNALQTYRQGCISVPWRMPSPSQYAAAGSQGAWLAEDLQRRLFEVVLAAGVQPERAFAVLDRDKDGLVSLADFAATLRELQLPLSNADLSLIARAWSRGERIDVDEFARQYHTWLRRRLGPKVRGAGPPDCAAAGGVMTRSLDGHFSQLLDGGMGSSDSAIVGGAIARSLDGHFSQLLDGDVGAESPPPVAARACHCFDLPSFVIFAFLDMKGEGWIPGSLMKRFVELCLGLSGGDATRVVVLCDLGSRDTVTYRDFRRYYDHVEQRRSARLTAERALQLSNLRVDVRAVLEAVDASMSSVVEQGLENAGDNWGVEAALLRRGRDLKERAQVDGLAELLRDLRLPFHVARPLLEWQVAIGLVHGTEGNAPVASYGDLLIAFRRARGLLCRHLDGLFGACLTAAVDLRVVFDAALRRPDTTVSSLEFVELLRGAGVSLVALDVEDVLGVLDQRGERRVSVPEVLQGYAEFHARYGAILGELADCLDRGKLAPDELFARVVCAARPPILGL